MRLFLLHNCGIRSPKISRDKTCPPSRHSISFARLVVAKSAPQQPGVYSTLLIQEGKSIQIQVKPQAVINYCCCCCYYCCYYYYSCYCYCCYCCCCCCCCCYYYYYYYYYCYYYYYYRYYHHYYNTVNCT